MAGAVIVDGGLRKRLNATLASRLFLRLFRNDIAVTTSSLLGAYTPASFPGYADLELTGLWPGAAIDAVGRAYSALYNLTWTRGAGGAPETIYGWVLYQDELPDSALICGRRLTTPRVLNAEGQTVVESIIIYLLRG